MGSRLKLPTKELVEKSKQVVLDYLKEQISKSEKANLNYKNGSYWVHLHKDFYGKLVQGISPYEVHVGLSELIKNNVVREANEFDRMRRNWFTII